MSTVQRAALVFSDLDGSLLDHHSYRFDAALPAIEALQAANIPLILVSSKTRAEIMALREELANTHPFISENGAAVYIPVNYFATMPPAATQRDGYWVYSTCPPRSHWVALLQQLEPEFPGSFDYFSRAGVDGIMQMTGLDEHRAAQANARDYSEPVRWLADEETKQRFVQRLEQAGASVQRGGRFMSVCADASKGRALLWLRERYQENHPAAVIHDLAVGDAENDRQMLEAAGSALLVRSPVHGFVSLSRAEPAFYSESFGPAGWAEGVLQWLENNGFTRKGS